VRSGGERGRGERGGEARPHRARVADEDPAPGAVLAGQEPQARLARGGRRVGRARESEARGGGLRDRVGRGVHAGTIPRPGHTRGVSARLHHERIAHGGAAPAAWLLLTHGIYGAGGNWRAIARKLVERRPDWGVVLVDLRQHGRSDAGEPPHTLDAAAGDLRALADQLGGSEAMAGHSFGGTVV